MVLVENKEKGEVELFLPYCPRCRTMMIRRSGAMLVPPKEKQLQTKDKRVIRLDSGRVNLPKHIMKNIAPGVEGTELSLGVIADLTLCCPRHPEQTESLTHEQLVVVNKYPVSKQVYRKIPLTKKV